MEKPPTMRDVAKMAHVSIQTVSAVINLKPGITAETTARVQAAIDALGYRPFAIGRSLRTRQTHTLGLVVSDIANPAFSTLASTVEDALHGLGYSLIVYNTHNDPQREKSCVEVITQRWIDGVLFVATGDNLIGLETLAAAGIPVVAIDRIPAGYGGPAVALDNLQAGALAAGHLIELGHRKIAHIRGPERLRLSREREAGFRQILAGQGLEPVCPECEAASWNCEAGDAAMREILACDPRLTAVFAASDRLAIGAMQAMREAGLRTPEDISVVGVDDIEVAAYQNPPLTTVRQSFVELGKQAVAMLLGLIQGQAFEAPQVKIDPILVIRKSTKTAN